MDEHTIEGLEVLDGDVTEFGNGAHVTVPKRWIGAKVKIVRTTEVENNE